MASESNVNKCLTFRSSPVLPIASSMSISLPSISMVNHIRTEDMDPDKACRLMSRALHTKRGGMTRTGFFIVAPFRRDSLSPDRGSARLLFYLAPSSSSRAVFEPPVQLRLGPPPSLPSCSAPLAPPAARGSGGATAAEPHPHPIACRPSGSFYSRHSHRGRRRRRPPKP
jgi:hypothetical protein